MRRKHRKLLDEFYSTVTLDGKLALLTDHGEVFAKPWAEEYFRLVAEGARSAAETGAGHRAEACADIVRAARLGGLAAGAEMAGRRRDPAEVVLLAMDAADRAATARLAAGHPEIRSEWGQLELELSHRELREAGNAEGAARVAQLLRAPSDPVDNKLLAALRTERVRTDEQLYDQVRAFAFGFVANDREEQERVLRTHPDTVAPAVLDYMNAFIDATEGAELDYLGDAMAAAAFALEICLRVGVERGLPAAWHLIDLELVEPGGADNAGYDVAVAQRALQALAHTHQVDAEQARRAAILLALAASLRRYPPAGADAQDLSAWVRIELQELAQRTGTSALRSAERRMIAEFHLEGPSPDEEAAIEQLQLALTDEASDHIERALVHEALLKAFQRRRTGDRSANLDEAARHAERSLAHVAESGLPDHAELHVMVTLAAVELDRGPFTNGTSVERAIRLYEEVARRGEQLGDAFLQGAAHNGLANAWTMRREGDAAEHLARALAAADAAAEHFLSGGDMQRWAVACITKGFAYVVRSWALDQDQLEDAVHVLQAGTAVLDSDDPFYAIGVVSLGNLLRARPEARLGIAEQSVASELHQAATKLRDRLPPFEWAIAEVSAARALAILDPGNAAEAIRRVEACLTELDSEDAPRAWADIQLVRGDLLAATGDEDGQAAAGEALDAALEVYEAQGHLSGIQQAASGLGDLSCRRGEWTAGVRHYEVAIEAAQTLRLATAAPGVRRGVLALTPALFRNCAYALSVMGKATEALRVAEAGRGLELDEACGADEEVIEAARRNPELTSRIMATLLPQHAGNGWAQWLAHDLPRGDALARPSEPAPSGELAQLVADARTAARSLEAATAPTPAPAPDEPIVYLVAAEWGTVALVVTINRDGHSFLVAGPTNEVTDIDVREALFGDTGFVWAQFGEPADLERALSRCGAVLEPVLGPLARLLDELGATKLTIIATGVLGLLPLHALPVGDGSGNGRRLGSGFDVAYALSAKSQQVQASRADGRLRPASLLSVAAPPGAPDALRWADDELRLLAALLAPDHWVAASDVAATLEAAPDADLIHFACHAEFEPVRPLESYLAIGQDELTARDIIANQVGASASLVVLSACRTAMSDWGRLPDELSGLPSAFVRAGAAAVIGTLWLVDDLSSALFMAYFGARLAGPATASRGSGAFRDALRYAQEKVATSSAAQIVRFLDKVDPGDEGAAKLREEVMRLSPADRPFASPYYWAAYVYIGP